MRLILKLIAAPFIVLLTVLFCRGQALDAVCRCMGGGYLVVKVRGKLTRCADGKLGLLIWNRSYNANCYCINKKHKCYYTNN